MIELQYKRKEQDFSKVNATYQLLIQSYQDVFTEPRELPPERCCDHTIPTKIREDPPNLRPYRVPHQQKEEMEQQIQKLLETSIIKPSASPYASPAILVKKKDGSWRHCIDYKKLNAQTTKNKYPILVIEDLLDELNGASVFSKLDLRSGYHQIRMSREDVHKMLLALIWGQYQ